MDPVQLSSAVSLIWPPLTAADDVGLEVLLDAVAVVEHASAVAAVAAYSVIDVLPRRGGGRGGRGRGSRRPLHLVRVAVRPDVADEVVLQLVNVLGCLLHDLGLKGKEKMVKILEILAHLMCHDSPARLPLRLHLATG